MTICRAHGCGAALAMTAYGWGHTIPRPAASGPHYPKP